MKKRFLLFCIWKEMWCDLQVVSSINMIQCEIKWEFQKKGEKNSHFSWWENNFSFCNLWQHENSGLWSPSTLKSRFNYSTHFKDDESRKKHRKWNHRNPLRFVIATQHRDISYLILSYKHTRYCVSATVIEIIGRVG